MNKLSKEFRDERTSLGLQNLRRCIQCDEIKSLSADFGDSKNGAGGKAGHCRACNNARSRERHNASDGLQGALDNGMKRAKKIDRSRSNIKPVDLKKVWEENGIDDWTCFYSGAPVVKERGHDNSREIDHIEPLALAGSAGHVMRNIVPTSRRWNQYKGDGRAVEKYIAAPPDLQPVQSYVGLAEGHAGVDAFGNPLAPSMSGWIKSVPAGCPIAMPFCQALRLQREGVL